MNVNDLSLSEEKIRTREQWGQDPCGAVHGREHELGTREFFDAVELHRYREYAPWMHKLMGFNECPRARLLEVGCGMGTDLLQFARGGAFCTGVDLTPCSIEISRHHFDINNMPGTFLISDAEQLPFSDESFDVVYSNGVLHHTPDTAAAIGELFRVLNTGGIAKVMLYYRHSLNFWFEMMLRRGVVGGELFRGRSAAEILSQWAEYSEHGGRPLVKVYSRRQVRNLFKDFSEISISIRQLTRAELRFFGRIIPERVFSFLEKSFGWNVIITARK